MVPRSGAAPFIRSMDTYRSKRRLVQIVSTILIVALPFLSILRLDIPTLRFYFLNMVLWVDEYYLLFLVAMLIMWVIVLFSMLYGRVWCGWVCPQTVLNELYHWFEHKARQWLKVPRSGGVWRHRALRAVVSIGAAGISLLVGFNLVAYFVDPYRMIEEIATLSLGPVTTGFIAGIAVLVFVDVMFWRERFCTRACPYAMLQVVVTDARTQIVRYHTERHDECIDCKACVRDCMMGIDIRTSPYQTECIHCGDCVDSCTAILGRLKKPLPSLISFSWGEKEREKRGHAGWLARFGLVDAKRWMLVGMTLLYAAGLVMVIQLRQPLSITASGDRLTLYHLGDDGRYYNEYTVRISNRGMQDGWFTIFCSSPHGGDCFLGPMENPVFLKSREGKDLKVTIHTDGENLHPGPNPLQLTAVNTADGTAETHTDVVFFMPEGESGAMMQSGEAL
jgi:cytochrome c oxidase accessory protein FixG